jgi:5-methyltetrahydrofolate--homocysteine methyltransferase
MRATLNHYQQNWTPPPRRGFLSSRSAVAEFGGGAPCALVGERINPTGKKQYTEELRSGKTAYIRREATAQVAAGAVLLDVNCGAPGVDEAEALERAVSAASGASPAPLVIDTSDLLPAGESPVDEVARRIWLSQRDSEQRSLERGGVPTALVTGDAGAAPAILTLRRRLDAARNRSWGWVHAEGVPIQEAQP